MVVGLAGKVDEKMDLQLNGKVALVTGSSKGIGNAIAKSLCDEGCNVVLNGRKKNQLTAAAKNFINTSVFVADVTNPNDCKSLIKHTIETWGKLDILVCNVGCGSSVPPGHETVSEWKRIFDINFFSTTNMIAAAESELRKTNGSILCISSIAGLEVFGAPITYSVAKSALNSYVKNISKPLAKSGIRINALAPGNIFFKGSVWEKKIAENRTKVNKMLKEHVALQRFGKPEEIAYFASFLVSPRCMFATGSVYVLDGGQLRS